MPPLRSILHLDMDAFFAAVERRENSALAGKPLLIGHDGPRGVVATASYEARVYGCHSAQPMAVARRLCPQALILPVRMELYSRVSDQMFQILQAFSPLVEPLSIDEAFLDLTGTQRLLGEPPEVARRLKDRIRNELGLTASVGVAHNKFLAKLASDMHKPDGLTVIDPQEVDRILLPMPASKLWGVGKVTAEQLRSLGIHTIGDLRKKPDQWLRAFFGAEAEHYSNLVHGRDDRRVVPDAQAKRIGHEQTFEADVQDAEQVRAVLLDQVQQVTARLRRHNLVARRISLKIRFGGFQTITRSTTLPSATDATTEFWHAARAVFDAWSFEPVRLIGVAAEALSNRGTGQMELFVNPEKERQRRLDAAADRINSKFGRGAIRRGGIE